MDVELRVNVRGMKDGEALRTSAGGARLRGCTEADTNPPKAPEKLPSILSRASILVSDRGAGAERVVAKSCGSDVHGLGPDRIIRMVTGVITGHDSLTPIHVALQAAWSPRRKAVAEVIRTALVLCADHELNVSAFTARCAASAGATRALYGSGSAVTP